MEVDRRYKAGDGSSICGPEDMLNFRVKTINGTLEKREATLIVDYNGVRKEVYLSRSRNYRIPGASLSVCPIQTDHNSVFLRVMVSRNYRFGPLLENTDYVNNA